MGRTNSRVWCIHPESCSEWFEYFHSLDGIVNMDPLVEFSEVEISIDLNDSHGNCIYIGDILECLVTESYDDGRTRYSKEITKSIMVTLDNIGYLKSSVKSITIIGHIHK